jgi:hypothetical protein
MTEATNIYAVFRQRKPQLVIFTTPHENCETAPV